MYFTASLILVLVYWPLKRLGKVKSTLTTIIETKDPFLKRILIVDDEPDLVSICKMVLEDRGFEVDEFTDSLFQILNLIYMIF